MSRQIRFLFAVVLVSFALSAAACADSTGPRPETVPCDTQSPNTCH